MALTAAARRGLIGKKITWETDHDRNRGTSVLRTGEVEAVKGRNIFLKDGDVGWFPEMKNLKVVKETP